MAVRRTSVSQDAVPNLEGLTIQTEKKDPIKPAEFTVDELQVLEIIGANSGHIGVLNVIELSKKPETEVKAIIQHLVQTDQIFALKITYPTSGIVLCLTDKGKKLLKPKEKVVEPKSKPKLTTKRPGVRKAPKASPTKRGRKRKTKSGS